MHLTILHTKKEEKKEERKEKKEKKLRQMNWETATKKGF